VYPSGPYVPHRTNLYGVVIKILALIFCAAIKPHFFSCDAHPMLSVLMTTTMTTHSSFYILERRHYKHFGGARRIRPSYNCGRNTSRSDSLGEKHPRNYSAGGFGKSH
jgi:hypothetical protein